MKPQQPDWSESLATMPARITSLTNFLHDRRFDKATSLISNLADDLHEVLEWIVENTKQELPKEFIPVTWGNFDVKSEDLVPTMKLRILQQKDQFLNVLQQWHYDRSKPDAAGNYPEGKWIDVPVEQ